MRKLMSAVSPTTHFTAARLISRFMLIVMVALLWVALLTPMIASAQTSEIPVPTDEAAATEESAIPTEEAVATEEAVSATTEASATEEVISVTSEAASPETAAESAASAAEAPNEAPEAEEASAYDLSTLMVMLGLFVVGGAGVLLVLRDRATTDDVV